MSIIGFGVVTLYLVTFNERIWQVDVPNLTGSCVIQNVGF